MQTGSRRNRSASMRGSGFALGPQIYLKPMQGRYRLSGALGKPFLGMQRQGQIPIAVTQAFRPRSQSNGSSHHTNGTGEALTVRPPDMNLEARQIGETWQIAIAAQEQQPQLLLQLKVATLAPPTATDESPSHPLNGQEVAFKTYTTTLFFRGEAAFGKDAGAELSMIVVSAKDDSHESQVFKVSEFDTTLFESEDPFIAGRKGPFLTGTKASGTISLPADLDPGVIILTLTAFKEPKPGDLKPVFLTTIELASGSARKSLLFLANSFVASSQGERYIFPAKACLPQHTPEGVMHFRRQELAAYEGRTPQETLAPRGGADRVYGFDVYNDLGKPDDPAKIRPILGTKALPFPRRVRTGRPMYKDTQYESRINEKNLLPWQPMDERFSLIKQRTFIGLENYSSGAAAATAPQSFVKQLISLPFLKAALPDSKFANLASVDALYKDVITDDKGVAHYKDLIIKDDKGVKDTAPPLGTVNEATTLKDLLHVLYKGKEEVKDEVDASLKEHAVNLLAKVLTPKLPPNTKLVDVVDQLNPKEQGVVEAVNLVNGALDRWPIPNVRKGRAETWFTDEDFGRQAMEGQDPLVLRALTTADLDEIATTGKDVAGLLEGASLLQRVAEGGRMYIMDFYTHFVDYLHRVNGLPGPIPRVAYAGRCILYSRNDTCLVPVSIELTDTKGKPLTVYTPHQSPELWRLAKTIIASLETWHHQAISHLLQTHLCVEPYIIATRRHLSIMHPVNKLLQPHFRWTMRPNADARQNLISADGIIETAFTIGPFSMELIAKIYGSEWRFDRQSLPDDLIARGVAERGADGEVKVTLKGYAYAEDGLLIYNALARWVERYIGLYYDDEGRNGKLRVREDHELMDWWDCIRFEGHPDKKEGWPEIRNTAGLKAVLANIMWTTSAHHAAVNYGQYQYSGYMPNRPSMIRRHIPLPGSKEEEELCNDFEGYLMSVISDPLSAATIMLMTKMLSHHSADEEFINAERHPWITDPDALKLYGRFVAELNDAEEEMKARNQSPARLSQGHLPYTQMMPSIDLSNLPAAAHGDPGSQVSDRGIPTSIAI